MSLANELSEKSKRDDAIIVGSEIRAALQEQRSEIESLKIVHKNEIDSLTASHQAEIKKLKDELAQERIVLAAEHADFVKQNKVLLDILRDYPKGQDDGTWIKRVEEVLKC